MIRILLVAPDHADLNVVPEIRYITGKHKTTVLNGQVTIDDLYVTCRYNDFDVIHFASHAGVDQIQVGDELKNNAYVELSDGKRLTPDDVAQLVRMSRASTVFFNACTTGVMALYLVRHGATHVVYGNVDVIDRNAWKFAAAFYDALVNGANKNVAAAFMVADSGDGTYGWVVSPVHYQQLVDANAYMAAKRKSTWTLSKWQLVLLLATTGFSVITSLLALVR